MSNIKEHKKLKKNKTCTVHKCPKERILNFRKILNETEVFYLKFP